MTTIQTTEERPIEPRRPWTTIEEAERQPTRVSWGAIFAGAALAVVLSVVLNVLGFGIGALAVDPAEAGQAQAIGIGAAIWTLVVSLIALFAGGWIAGRLSGKVRPFEGLLHGLVTWSLVTLAVFWLVTTAVGSVVGGAFGVVGEAAPAAAEQVQQQDLGQAQQQIEQQAGQVGQQAGQVAERAGDITGGTAIALAIAMILGGAAAAGGGVLGSGARRKELASARGESLH